MRPAKYFIALLFGAAVLITFLKLLFFAIMAAAVLGTLYFAFRGAGYMMANRGHFAHSHAPRGGYPAWNNGYQNAEPIDPRQFQSPEKQAFTRHIEVL